MADGEVGGRCKSCYFLLTLVREKVGDLKVDPLCEHGVGDGRCLVVHQFSSVVFMFVSQDGVFVHCRI